MPSNVRAASARALEFADPPAPLVRLFALDDLAIALPVLRSARMNSSEWVQLLPDLAPAARSVLRNRRDLGPVVKRALEAFGPSDFILSDETVKDVPEASPQTVPTEIAAPESEPLAPETQMFEWPQMTPIEANDEVTNLVDEPSDISLDAPAAIAQAVEIGEAEEADPVAAVAGAFEVSLAEETLPVAEAGIAIEENIEAVVDTYYANDFEPEPESALSYWSLGAAGRIMPAAPRMPLPNSPHEAPPSVEEAEDFSFVELATASPVGAVRKPASVDQSEVVAHPIQSGTADTAPVSDAIAPVDAPPQGFAMDDGFTAAEASAEMVATDAAVETPVTESDEVTFEIADVVKRIDAFWRHREKVGVPETRAPARADQFRFETDSNGILRWIDGVSRSALVGLSLDAQAGGGIAEASRVDGIASGAFSRRAGFSNARLSISGESDAAGDWLISAIPVFDPANGRFTGYRGTARRPRVDERADPVRAPLAAAPADSLRQLVHELRTPTNAIAGFAEMIESQILGPVNDIYRERAGTIRGHARELLGAIDDIDLAARIDSAALSLVPARIALRPVLSSIADDLAQLASIRGSAIALPIEDLAITGDRRAVERLLARLMATLVSASGPGERIGVNLSQGPDGMVSIAIDRPSALADYPGDTVLGIDDEREDSALLGTGFALRLARNLARELGGAMTIGPESLTLRLPAPENALVGQAHLN